MTETSVPQKRLRRPAPGSLPGFAARPVLGIAAAFVALELSVAARYGIHRDELYFLACARHLAWGYVDQPPLVPALAWLSTHLAGTSAVVLRTGPALAGGASVVMTGLMARELNGGHRAQALSALAAATSPQVVATFHLLSTAAFDQFFWCAITFVLLRQLRTNDERLWPAIAALVGLALMNKLNVAFLIVGLAFGLVVTGRARVFRSPWLGLSIGLAVLMWLPNLVWNAEHQWAALAMLHSLHRENSNVGSSLGFIPAQLVVVGPVLIVWWVAGLRRLLATPIGRPFGFAYLFLLALFTLAGAKSYYLAGMYFVLFAAGGAWAEDRLTERSPRRAEQGVRRGVVVMVAGGLVALPLALPVLPASALPGGAWEGQINKDLSATVGWPQFVGQIAAVSARLPTGERATLVVFTGDYGAAGAIDLYGSTYALPPAISGHNSYWWWGPGRAANGATTIAVDLPKSYLLTIFSQVTLAGTVGTPDGVWTEERGDPIWVCRGQKVTWAEAWLSAKHYG